MSDLDHSFEDLASPINTLLTEDLTFSSLSTLYKILHEAYGRFDMVVQDAAAVGLHFSPTNGERLTQFDTDKMLRRLRQRNAVDRDIRPHAEDVRQRADRVERQIGEVEKAIKVKADNDRIDAIVFQTTLERYQERETTGRRFCQGQ